jgi:hypothetical protein
MTYPTELRFTSHVMGNNAAYELCKHSVNQTIRSHFSLPSYDDGGLKDAIMSVWLDAAHIGVVEVYKIQAVSFRDLTEFDAEIGGFSSLEELKKALRRAGFRFRPLEQYDGYRVRFRWVMKEVSK